MFSQMVHYTSTSALCVQSKQLKNEDASFGSLLRKASSMGDIRNCPVSSNWNQLVQYVNGIVNCLL